jgi:O-antigen/teichoic acid export membrane protein
MTAGAVPGRIRGLAAAFRWQGTSGRIALTAGSNVAATAAAGLGGIVVARVLGPAVRGEYAAIMAWFGVALMAGSLGQPAAVCYYVSHEAARARDYVATSRVLMLGTGAAALIAGMALAPVLGHGNAALATGYRIAFAATVVAFLGATYTFSLQARDLAAWNAVRVSQPVLSLLAIIVLWRLGSLTLDSALAVLAVTMTLQLCLSYQRCRRAGLAPGRFRPVLAGPLAGYGAAQMAALAPAALNANLDQLVLSQTVPAADLGCYAVAVSLTLLPTTVVSAIGYVAFPSLASQRVLTDAGRRLQSRAVRASATTAIAMLVPLSAAAPWLVPLVFGPGYAKAVPLLWVLAPGAVFLACGQVAGDLLRGRKQPLVVAWAQGMAAIFTVVLLFALLPVAGVFAAAIASTIAYGVSLALLLRALWRPGRTGDGGRRSGWRDLRRATGATPVTRGDACESG